MSCRLVVFLLFTYLQSVAQDSSGVFQIHGYIKSIQTVTVLPHTDERLLDALLHNRLNFSYASGHWQARLEFRNRFFIGDQVRRYPRGQFTGMLPNDQGLAKPWWDWENGTSTAGFSEIDRYQLRYAHDKIAVTIGKQRIHWGVTNFWNANDLFNAYNFLDFDYEERAGREALRVQWFTGSNTGWEFVYAPSRWSGRQTGGALYKFNYREFDFQLLAALYQRDFATGGAWAGHFGKAGFKGEITWFEPLRPEDRGTRRLVISSGLDRTFEDSWYVQGGLLFNLLGDEPVEALSVTSVNLSAKQLSPYRVNILGVGMKTISPVTQAGMTVWYSPWRRSLLLFPTFSWNAAQNFDLDLLAQAFYQTELGVYRSGGAQVFARIRWSF